MDTQTEDRLAPPDQPPPFPDNVGMSSIMAYQNPTGLPGGASTPASLSERFTAATPGEASTVRPDGTLAPVNTGAVTSMPPGLQQQQLEIERNRIKTGRAITGQMLGTDKQQGLIDQDQQRMHRAYEAQGIGPSDLPNWQEQEQRQKFMHTPVEAFGSLGSIFAMVASAFTRKPMTNALNAGAAALNAVKSGDDKAYESAYNAWKENTNLALKRQQLQHQAYTDAIQLMSHDMAAGEAKFGIAARQYGDEALLSLYEHGGMSKQILDQIEHQNKVAEGLGQAKERMDREKLQEAAVKNDQRWKTGDPMQKWQVYNEVYGKQSNTPQSQLMQMYFNQHPNSTVEEATKFFTGAGLIRPLVGGNSAAATVGPNAEIKRRKDQFENDPNSPTYGDPTASYDRAVQSVQQAKVPAGAMIDEKTAEIMAEQYLAGDKSVMQNLRGGAAGQANIAMLRRKIREAAEERGLKGQDIAIRMAEFAGVTAAERATGDRAAKMLMFGKETLGMLDIAEERSKELTRTQWVPFNKAIQAFQSQTGDPKIVAFGESLFALSNAYAKAINGGNQATDSDKQEARRILSEARTQQQFEAISEVIRGELQRAIDAPGQVRQELRKTFQDGPAAGGSMTPKGVTRYDADGNRITAPATAATPGAAPTVEGDAR